MLRCCQLLCILSVVLIVQDSDERQELNDEDSQFSAELHCTQSDLMQQRVRDSHLAEKCKCLEFSIASLEQEKIALQETSQKSSDKVLELQR